MERTTRRVLGIAAAVAVVVAGGVRVLTGCASGRSPDQAITESYRRDPASSGPIGRESQARAMGESEQLRTALPEGLADAKSLSSYRITALEEKEARFDRQLRGLSDTDNAFAMKRSADGVTGGLQPQRLDELTTALAAKPEVKLRDPAPAESKEGAVDAPGSPKDEAAAKEQNREEMRKSVELAQGVRRLAVAPEQARKRLAESTAARPEPRFDEELWVITKAGAGARAASDDVPGSGGLVCVPGEGRAQVPVPLKHTDVRASVTGYVSSVTVTQQFHNPFASKIEAVYVFPLPENAAVSDFLMKVGERTIRGVIREKGEAEKIYYAARAQGYAASLLTQERPNIFTQKVANIDPQKSIDISITYFNTLSYSDGAFEFVFPMVVGPRFNPPYTPGQDRPAGEGIGAVARGDHGASGEGTEVQYLRPGERSGHDISVNLSVDLGMEISEIKSASHAIKVERPSGSTARVTLSSLDTIPNKDLVVRIRPGGEGVRTGLIVQKDERGAFFSMMIVPPAELSKLSRGPMELVFVVDCSGSMSGYPLDKAKQCIDRALTNMRSGDTFQIIRFAAEAAMFADRPQPVTAENVRRGREWLKNLEPGGGTYMIEGVRAALNYPHDAGRERVVCFMTDGYIGNEGEILGEIRKGLGPTHIFSFGVGTSVNRYLMDSMARVGRGAVAYVGPGDDVADAMDPFIERISRSAMTELAIDWGGAKAVDVFPRRLPDLYVGRPVMITGRLEALDGFGNLTIHGKIRSEGGFSAAAMDVRMPALTGGGSLAQIWARAKIAQMGEEQLAGDSTELREAIRDTALGFNLMSPYTAFVAVDTMTRTSGDSGTTVAVPVPVPEGVKFQTTVTEK